MEQDSKEPCAPSPAISQALATLSTQPFLTTVLLAPTKKSGNSIITRINEVPYAMHTVIVESVTGILGVCGTTRARNRFHI